MAQGRARRALRGRARHRAARRQAVARNAGRGAQCGGERAMMSPVSQSLPLLLHNLFLFSHNIPISIKKGSFLQVMNNEWGRVDR